MVFILLLLLVNTTMGGQLERLIDYAIKNSPRLSSYEGLILSRERMVDYSKSLENPKLSLGLNNLPVNKPYPTPTEPMSSFSIGFSQMWTLPVKRERESQVFQKEKEMIKARYEMEKRELIKDIKENYYKYQYTFKKEDLYKNLLRELELLEKLVEENYKLGRASLSEIISIRVKKKEIERLNVDLLRERNNLIQQIHYLTGGFGDVEREDVKPREETIYKGVQQNPAIREVETQIGTLRAEIDRAKVEYLPNVEFMAEYMFRPGQTDMFNLRVGLSLPLWKSRREDLLVLEKLDRLSSAMKTLEDTKLRVIKEINTLHSEHARNLEALKILRETEEEKLREIKALEDSYKYNKVDLRELLKAFLELWEIRLMSLDRELELLLIEARLEALI